MMQPQSTLFRGPNEHVGPLKKDQCALTPKICPLRKALHWGEGARRVRGRIIASAKSMLAAPAAKAWRQGAHQPRGPSRRQRAAHLCLERAAMDQLGERDVLERDAERFEQGDVRLRLAAAPLARHEIAE